MPETRSDVLLTAGKPRMVGRAVPEPRKIWVPDGVARHDVSRRCGFHHEDPAALHPSVRLRQVSVQFKSCVLLLISLS